MRRGKCPETLQRFAAAVATDELEEHLCGPVWSRLVAIGHWRPVLHIHHIFHAGTRKDLWWNLVRVTEAAHAYLHKEPVGGMVACMYAVLHRATADDREELRSQWRSAFGRDAIGWLQAKRDAGEIPACYLDMTHLILESF